MCLAIPGRITEIDRTQPEAPVAWVDFGIAVKRANLLYTPEAVVGDYVIVHAGFATTILPETEALEALACARQIDAERAASSPSPVVTG